MESTNVLYWAMVAIGAVHLTIGGLLVRKLIKQTGETPKYAQRDTVSFLRRLEGWLVAALAIGIVINVGSILLLLGRKLEQERTLALG